MDDREKRLIEKIEQADEFGMLDDGYQYYFPNHRGALSAANLRTIADELDRRNAKWDEIVQREFSGQQHIDD